jgi:hypothetical protein
MEKVGVAQGRITMIKIQIANKDESARAFVALARDNRITCLPNDVYVIPDTALDILRNLGVTFQQLASGENGHAPVALRSPAADPIQRR